MLRQHLRTRYITVIAALTLGALAGNASADNSQQSKMTSCNADATSQNLKGDDRKAFMKTCLSSAPAASAKTNSQQEKMKACNAQASAKSLKGNDRKQFMSTCLRGS
jgi:psiF repeat